MIKIKKIISRFPGIGFLFQIGFLIQKLIYKNQFIRVVNYHCINKQFEMNFKSHIEFYKKNYICVNEHTLKVFLDDKKWPYKKPGIIICFDDGLNCAVQNGLKILEEYNFTCWLMVPIGFLLENPRKHDDFINDNLIDCYCNLDSDISRRAMPPDSLKEIQHNGHTITAHTINHTRMSNKLDLDTIKKEILYGRDLLSKYTEKTINSFAWVGGEEEYFNPDAIRIVNNSNYTFSFIGDGGLLSYYSNPKSIGRMCIDSAFNLNLCKFYLSGIMDLFYMFRRSRIQNKIKISSQKK